MTADQIAQHKIDFYQELELFQKKLVTRALELAKNNRQLASELLCIKRTTLVEIMRRLGLLETTPKPEASSRRPFGSVLAGK